MSSAGDSVGAGERLGHLVRKYKMSGQDLTTDARLAEAVLLDAFPEFPAEVVRALVEAVRCDAVNQLEESASHGAPFAIGLSSSYLASNSGLREDLCRWAAEAWWSALFAAVPSGEVTEIRDSVRGGLTESYAGWGPPGVAPASTTPPMAPPMPPPPQPGSTSRSGAPPPSATASPSAPSATSPLAHGLSPGAKPVFETLGTISAAVIVVASVLLQKGLYLAGSRTGQAIGALVIVVASAIVLGSVILTQRAASVSRRWLLFDGLSVIGAAAVMIGALLLAWLFVPGLAKGTEAFTLHDFGDALAVRWLVPIIAASIVVEVLAASRWSRWPRRSLLAVLSAAQAAIVLVALVKHGIYGADTSLGKGAWLALGGAILGIVAAVGRAIPSRVAPATADPPPPSEAFVQGP